MEIIAGEALYPHCYVGGTSLPQADIFPLESHRNKVVPLVPNVSMKKLLPLKYFSCPAVSF